MDRSEVIEDAKAALAGWEPISTAPLDGSQFLAALTNGWVIIMSGDPRWKTERPHYAWWRTSYSIPYEPSHPKNTDWDATHTLRATHWQPLPPPPSA